MYATTRISAAFFRLCLAFGAVGLVAGCSSSPLDAVTSVFGGDGDKASDDGDDKKKKKKDDEDDASRFSILAIDEALEPDPRFAGVLIELPPSYKNESWTQPGGEADHTLHHLNAPLEFEKLWTAKVGAASERARLTAPPVVADGRIYVVDARAEVSAFDTENGDLLWRSELTPTFKERFRIREILVSKKASEIGFGGGVAFDDGKVFVTSGFGFVAALDAKSGETLWKFETESPIRTPPTAYRGAVYFVTNTNEFIALDAEKGERQWGFQSFEERARILSSASPAAAGDLVVAPFSSGELVAFLATNGRTVWNDTLASNVQLTALASLNDIAGSPVIDRGLVYVVSHAGRMAGIDIRTGERIWEAPIAGVQMPWVAGDFIFVVSVDSELLCVSRSDGAVVWVSQLPRFKKEKGRKGRITWAGPILAGDNLILVSSEGRVARVSPETGKVLQEEKIGDGAVVSPIVADEKIFVLSEAGKLYALR